MRIKPKRIYDPPARGDGVRVLVDRLWPRGLKKDDAKFDLWLKEIAPSTPLRKWFAHRPDRWSEFRERYFRELDHNPGALAVLRAARKRNKSLTLLYAAHDTECNHAVALADYLSAEMKRGASSRTRRMAAYAYRTVNSVPLAR